MELGHSAPSFRSSQITAEERLERLKEPKTVDNGKEIVSSGHGRSAEDKNSQRW